MKLWILKAIDEDGGTWDPWYDKAFGFVVRAETEEDARRIVADGEYGNEGPGPWLSKVLSTCEELTPDGEAGLILRDFAAA